MHLLPLGSFKMKFIEGKDSAEKTVSVQSFFMSNEITNKEYREFVNDLRLHPTDSLTRLDIRRASYNRFIPNDSLKTKHQHWKTWFTSIKYSELLKNIIDSNVWANEFSDSKKMQEKYLHYFSDKYFDDYPVVGVSYSNAFWFCNWKSKKENEAQLKKKEQLLSDYRLPTEAEWAYAAQETVQTSSSETQMPVSVKKGKINNFGLRNMGGNISEWTNSTPFTAVQIEYTSDYSAESVFEVDPNQKIIRGANWKENKSGQTNRATDKNFRSNVIGFRIVKTRVYTSGSDEL